MINFSSIYDFQIFHCNKDVSSLVDSILTRLEVRSTPSVELIPFETALFQELSLENLPVTSDSWFFFESWSRHRAWPRPLLSFFLSFCERVVSKRDDITFQLPNLDLFFFLDPLARSWFHVIRLIVHERIHYKKDRGCFSDRRKIF